MPTHTLEDRIANIHFSVTMLRGLCRTMARLADQDDEASD